MPGKNRASGSGLQDTGPGSLFRLFLGSFFLLTAVLFRVLKEWGGDEAVRMMSMLMAPLFLILIFFIPILVVLEAMVVVSVLVIFSRERVALGFRLLLLYHGMLYMLFRIS